jgi:hypothetical protein
MKRLAILVVTLAIVGTAGGARGAETPNTGPPDASHSLGKFYAGPLGHTGAFPGKLLCLCCDLMPDTGKPKTCDAHGHHHVLLVDGDIHVLVAGTAEVTKQINSDELHGKNVVVTGNYYPATGFIFVDNIRVQ